MADILSKNLDYKNIYTKVLCVALSLVMLSSCNSRGNNAKNEQCDCFTPAELVFKPAFCRVVTGSDDTGLEIFVQVTDTYGDTMKVPGMFRIELYQKDSQSQENIGRRLSINNADFLEIDMRDQSVNQKYWDRITGCYRLKVSQNDLPNEIVVQVTWFYSDKYRLTDTIIVETK